MIGLFGAGVSGGLGCGRIHGVDFRFDRFGSIQTSVDLLRLLAIVGRPPVGSSRIVVAGVGLDRAGDSSTGNVVMAGLRSGRPWRSTARCRRAVRRARRRRFGGPRPGRQPPIRGQGRRRPAPRGSAQRWAATPPRWWARRPARPASTTVTTRVEPNRRRVRTVGAAAAEPSEAAPSGAWTVALKSSLDGVSARRTRSMRVVRPTRPIRRTASTRGRAVGRSVVTCAGAGFDELRRAASRPAMPLLIVRDRPVSGHSRELHPCVMDKSPEISRRPTPRPNDGHNLTTARQFRHPDGDNRLDRAPRADQSGW